MTPFELLEPRSLRKAAALLGESPERVRPLGGGTAVMLMMKMGVLRAARLVSLRAVEKRYHAIAKAKEGGLRIGALATLSAIERAAAAHREAPVVVDTLRTLANVRVRNQATLGGHLAHADPHLDLPPVLIALGAEVETVGPEGSRRFPLEQLYSGYLETTLQRGELIAHVHVPRQRPRRAAYVKCTTRCADDWPALGLAIALDMDGAGIRDAKIVLSAATDTPTRLREAERALQGREVTDAMLRAAGDAAVGEAVVQGDAHGSAAYKKELLRVHVGRAVRKALGRA